MNTGKLAIAAIVLWFVTIAIFGWFFVQGNTIQGTDTRTTIVLKPGERELVLSEMRGMLAATHGVLVALKDNNMHQVAKAARTAGMAAAVDVNPALMAKLPLEFKQLGMSVHQGMDDLAIAAESGKPSGELMGMMTDTLSRCIACHASWQIQAGN